MKKLFLYNRYGDEVYLEKTNDKGTFKLCGLDGCLNVSIINETDYAFVDPSGGPVIAVGDDINNILISKHKEKYGKIKRVYKGDKCILIDIEQNE